jgi:hypothetical protein
LRVQDPANPARLLNHDNAVLHYEARRCTTCAFLRSAAAAHGQTHAPTHSPLSPAQDDWYVAAFKPDAYALIYYRGRNDAWDGAQQVGRIKRALSTHAPLSSLPILR